jgi:hypothetical protein
MASDRIYFVPLKAKRASVSSVPETPVAGTNLKRNSGKTEDSLCDRIQLEGVNLSLGVPFGRTDLCEDSPVLNSLVHNTLCRCIHHRGVFL